MFAREVFILLVLQEGQTVADSGKHVLCKPSFLQTMLKEIVFAGKSMELLTSLEHRVDILRGTSLSVQLQFCASLVVTNSISHCA